MTNFELLYLGGAVVVVGTFAQIAWGLLSAPFRKPARRLAERMRPRMRPTGQALATQWERLVASPSLPKVGNTFGVLIGWAIIIGIVIALINVSTH